MPTLKLDDVSLYYREDGPRDGPIVVFANSLGTSLHLWDPILSYLPDGLRLIRMDKRGHGRSSIPTAPYTMGDLIRDTEQVLDHLQVRECVFVGLSIGGMIAQGLAVKRPDLIRALVISNTAAKIGTPEIWNDRLKLLSDGGLESMADGILERWFSRTYRESDAILPWRKMLVDTPQEGYGGCAAAISGTDLYTSTSGLRLPTLAIAGSEDGSTPADLVRETQQLIPGSKFHLIRGAGHLPCVEKPMEYAQVLKRFLRDVGHVS